MKFKIGDEVYWRPKGAKRPTFGLVTGINREFFRHLQTGDDIYNIATERKGEVEAFEHQLTLFEDKY